MSLLWKQFSFLLFASLLFSFSLSERKVKTLYNSLDPRSIPQHLALYELYPDVPIGQQALRDAWNLLAGHDAQATTHLDPLPLSAIDAMIALVNKQPHESLPTLENQELEAIEALGQRLANRRVKGVAARTEEEVFALPSHEIDVSRALFLTQVGAEDEAKIRVYEAMIDLMALQILTKISPNASPEEKIQAINELIFFDMGFRFPPHSLYAKDIDLYTFLPSVLDSRHGVCLGVSILYLSLAQRLDLPLEIVTPPGHIYIRYRDEGGVINIETTARGIHVDSKEYLSIDTRSLQERELKEVIGLVHINQASVYWESKDYVKALESYKKALPYLPDDKLLQELMGYNELFLGNKEEGEQLLKQVKDYLPDYSVSKSTLIEDYFSGAVDKEGIEAVFMPVDETRESILKKKQILEKILEKCPRFREGWTSLAIAWLQLHREKEALQILEKCHAMDPNDPKTEYYLAMLYAERFCYSKAWEHCKTAEQLVQKRQHDPKALKQLRKQLTMLCPE